MFQRYLDEGLAQISYLIACDRAREAVVVDPRRDVDIYVSAARQQGLTLAYAVESHIHADFVSGSRELAALGVRIITGPGSGLSIDHHEVRDGEQLRIGDVTLDFHHTPGHTPEHISILVEEQGQPRRLLSGDTLFVGGVGRPDLLGASATTGLVEALYDSLYKRVLAFDDDVEVHPGHGAGSLCGSGIGADPYSTIGRERRTNPMLAHLSKDAFVSAVLADLPETPPYFRRMKIVNHDGAPVLRLTHGVDPPRSLAPHDADEAIRRGAVLLDLRSPELYAQGHPTGALNIGFGANVGYWAGWVIPAESTLVLLADNERDAHDARRQLLRVGLDRVEGYLEGGFDAWRKGNLPVSTTVQATADELRNTLTRGARVRLIDVRTTREWNAGHIDGAVHIPVGALPARVDELAGNGPIATICEAGFRSSLAASLLERAGISGPIVTVTGGMAAFRALESRT